jgi:hypothetical protein
MRARAISQHSNRLSVQLLHKALTQVRITKRRFLISIVLNSSYVCFDSV